MVSGVTLLAVPAYIYSHGIGYWLSSASFISASAITYFVYLPVFYELRVTSIYEYLSERFDSKVRTFASALCTISTFMYLPIVVYIPALAFSQASGISIHVITPIICAVCIFYTTVGGLRAVVWTDALQLVLMIGSITTIFYLGVSTTGGFENVWKKNIEHKRIAIDFNLDPTSRFTFWSSTLGLAVNWFCYTSINQGIIQKCISLPNYKSVRNALSIFAVGIIAMVSVCCFTGLIMFARYSECDPLTSGKIEEPDQLLTYYVMDVAKTIPGLAGLFTAGIFSAALSTLSAVMNSFSATIYKDFLSGYIKKDTSEKTISNYLKILAVTIGIISTALVYAIPYMGSLVPLTMSLSGIVDGTSLGIFTSALLLPGMNAKGVLCGGIVSVIVMSWVVFGSQYYKSVRAITYPSLPVSTTGCQNLTILEAMTKSTQFNDTSSNETPFVLYRISCYYYIIMGALIVILVGLVVSKLTPKCNKELEKKYFSPIIRNLVSNTNQRSDYYYLH